MNEQIKPAFLSAAAAPSVDPESLRRLFDQVGKNASDREKNRHLPFEMIEIIREARFGALRLRSQTGGGGYSIRDLLRAVIGLAASDANVAHILRNHFSVVERLIRTPYDDQSRSWQNEVAKGAIIGMANTELGTAKVGAVPHATILTVDAGGYRLNGTKYYSTGSLFADLVLVRTQFEGRGASVLIPTRRSGIELVDDWDGMGQRLTGTGTTHFDGVRCEASEVVFDDADTGYGIPYTNTFAQLYLTAINAGIIRAVLRDAKALVQRRSRNFYYAPAEQPALDPLLQLTVGQISSAAFAAESTVLAAADALDEESLAREGCKGFAEQAARAALAAAQAKVVIDELAIQAGGQLFDVGGASATERVANLDRHWRNARTIASHNPRTLKARAIGDLEINGTPLPAKGFF